MFNGASVTIKDFWGNTEKQRVGQTWRLSQEQALVKT
jgi:hypothetical protein